MPKLVTLSILLMICTFSTFGNTLCNNPRIDTLPKIALYNIQGDTTTLEEFARNKLTFIDFWFIPCGACFSEMHMLHKLYDKYKDNSKVSFITICNTDSSFVRPLIENRNTADNETYDYFKSLSDLKKFKLSVYFINGATSKVYSFKKEKMGFHSKGEPRLKGEGIGKLFGFTGFPTIYMYDKTGKLIYRTTGFDRAEEHRAMKEIEKVIEANL